MGGQATRKLSIETVSSQNIPGTTLTIVPPVPDHNGQVQHASILKFIYRIIRDRSLYGALAFAETAESLRLNVEAMRVGSRDRVVGITASGDLLLSLLAAGPEEIVGFDANPSQTVLTHLKIASIQALSVQEYLKFMGVKEMPPGRRVEVFNRVSRNMPSPARRYMLNRYDLVKEGILNHGMSHQITQVIAALLSRVLNQDTVALFLGQRGTDEDRLDKLKQLTKKPSTRFLQKILKAAAPRLKWLFFPHRFCEISTRPDEIIADFLNTFKDLLVQGATANPVLCRASVGQLHPEWTDHLYNEGAFRRIRRNIARLSLDTTDILSGLRQVSDAWATRIYLSNVPDYLSTAQLNELTRELQRAAAPGARIVYYSLYDQDLLHSIGPKIDEDELQALQKSDNVFIYPTLMVRHRAAL